MVNYLGKYFPYLLKLKDNGQLKKNNNVLWHMCVCVCVCVCVRARVNDSTMAGGKKHVILHTKLYNII